MRLPRKALQSGSNTIAKVGRSDCIRLEGNQDALMIYFEDQSVARRQRRWFGTFAPGI